MMDYQPLNFTTFEFRLLTILPIGNEEDDGDDDGDDDGIIRCSLDHRSLLEPPKYRALSYCWGDPGVTTNIIVNGKSMEVTTNLESALREFRSQNLMTFWVDSLCINQQDVAERGLQVTRMGLTYFRAVEVIVWLGEEADNSGSAMVCLNEESRKKSPDLMPPSIKPAIFALLERPFWRRVWIIQEVSKSRKLRVFCGAYNIAWEQMYGILASWKVVPPAIEALQKFRSVEQFNMGINRPELIRGLFETLHSLSTDPRDKIFAILGLCSDGPYLVQSPNYVQPPERIYFDLLLALISRNPKLSYMAREESTSNTLPASSVTQPEWTTITHGIQFWILNALLGKQADPIKGFEMDPIAHKCFPVSRRAGIKGLEDFPSLTFSGLRASVVVIDSILQLSDSHYDSPDGSYLKANPPEASDTEARHAMTCFGNALLLPQTGCGNYNYFEGFRDLLLHPSLVACALTYLCTRSSSNHVCKHKACFKLAFADWHRNNASLKFRGQTLKMWARIYSQSSEYKSEAFSLLSLGRGKREVRGAVVDASSLMIKGIQWAKKHDLYLVVGQKTKVIQLVPREVMEGDLICRIRYSWAPIFIRPEDRSSYRFVSFSRASPWLCRKKDGYTQDVFNRKVGKEIWDWVNGVVKPDHVKRQERKWETITMY